MSPGGLSQTSCFRSANRSCKPWAKPPCRILSRQSDAPRSYTGPQYLARRRRAAQAEVYEVNKSLAVYLFVAMEGHVLDIVCGALLYLRYLHSLAPSLSSWRLLRALLFLERANVVILEDGIGAIGPRSSTINNKYYTLQ